MNLASPILTTLFHVSFQAGLLALLILATKAALGSRLTPRWHHAIWLLLIARLVVPVGPSSRLSLSNYIALPNPAAKPVPAIPTVAPAMKEYPAPSRSETEIVPRPLHAAEAALDPVRIVRVQESHVHKVPVAGPAVPAVTRRARTIHVSPTEALAIAWLCGAGLFLLVLAVNTLGVGRHVRRGRAVTDPSTLATLEECRVLLGIRRQVRLLETCDVASPALVGVMRPAILIPAKRSTDWREDMRYVLLHELTHLKRSDIVLGYVVALLQAIHWFNPLLWYAFHRMRSDRELACDAEVLSHTSRSDVSGYARAILNIAESSSGRRSFAGAAGILENQTQLRRRITMISRYGSRSTSRIVGIGIAALLAVVGLTEAQPPSAPVPKSVAPSAPKISVSGAGVRHHLPGRFVVTGRVLDAETSKPLAGAEVTYGRPANHRTAVSDAGGRFRIEGPFTNGSSLMATRKGYVYNAQSRGRTSPPDGEGGTLEIEADVEMVPGVTLCGTVRFEDGSPAMGANVLKQGFSLSGGSEVVNNKGEYCFSVSRYSSLAIEARLDGYASGFSGSMQVDDRDVTVPAIVLSTGCTVSGMVSDPAGAPAPDTTVTILKSVQVGDGFPIIPVGVALSDSAGNFTIAHVPDGEVRLRVEKHGFASTKGELVSLKPKEVRTGTKLKLETSRYIAGRVTDATGSPVRGAVVQPMREDLAAGERMRRDVTDSDGRYRVDGLALATYRVQVVRGTLPSGQFDSSSAFKNGIKPDCDNLDFVLGGETKKENVEKGVLIGRVIDSQTSKPVSEYAVSVENNSSAQAEKYPQRPGQFSVRGLKPGLGFRLHISSPGYLDEYTDWLSIRSADKPEEKVFVLGSGGDIRGRAVDPDTSKPLEGVRVAYYPGADVYSTSSPSKTAVTGADGRFSLEHVRTGKSTLIFSPTAADSSFSRQVQVQHGIPTDLGDVAMWGHGVIAGKLLDRVDGRPAAGARITVSGGGRIAGSCVTGGDGTFRIEKLMASSYTVRAPDMGVWTGVTLKDGETRDIVLRPGGVLTGRVVRGGSPVDRVQVSLKPPDGGIGLMTNSDSEGRFKYEGLTQGKWKVNALYRDNPDEYIDNIRFADDTVDVGPEPVEKTISLPARRVEGRVIDSSGKPLRGVTVGLRCTPDAYHSWSDSQEARTTRSRDDGGFAFTGLEAGEYQLSANCGNDGYACEKVMLQPAESAAEKVTLTVRKLGTGSIVSVARTADGRACPDAWCNLNGPNGRYDHSAKRDANGVITIQNVPAGTYQVEVSSWGRTVGIHTVEIKPDGTAHIEDNLAPAGAINWTLTDRGGAPLKGIRCKVVGVDVEKTPAGLTDQSGTWTVRGLIPGKYSIEALTSEGKVLRTSVDVVAGKPIAVATKEE